MVANLIVAEVEMPFEEMRRIARAVEAHAATSRSATSVPRYGSSLAAYTRTAFTFDTSSTTGLTLQECWPDCRADTRRYEVNSRQPTA